MRATRRASGLVETRDVGAGEPVLCGWIGSRGGRRRDDGMILTLTCRLDAVADADSLVVVHLLQETSSMVLVGEVAEARHCES